MAEQDRLTAGAAGEMAEAWLDNPADTRLLVLTSAAPDSATRLAARLVLRSANLTANARIHAQASVRGLDPRTTAWILAAQIGVCVHGPGDLVAHLAADRRPVTVLIAELDAAIRSQDGTVPSPLIEELLRPLLEIPHLRLIASSSDQDIIKTVTADQRATVIHIAPEPAAPGQAASQRRETEPAQLADDVRPQPSIELSRLLTAPQPDLSVAIGISETTAPKNIKALWQISGQALTVAAHTASTRAALLHLGALGIGDLEIARDLEPYLANAPYTARWARFPPVSQSVAVDEPSAWLGQITALGAGRGVYAKAVIAADTLGRFHILNPADGTVLGRFPHSPLEIGAFASMETGALLIADLDGRLALIEPPAQEEEADRLADLLDPERSPASHLRSAITDLHALASTPIIVLAACPGGNALVWGGNDGVIHTFDLTSHMPVAGALPLHAGPVAALATAIVPETGELAAISGGFDGRLEAVTFGRQLGGTLIEQRGTRVTAIAISPDSSLICAAWADGRITRWREFGETELEPIDLGWTPTALHLAEDSLLLIGGHAGLAALQLPA